MPMPILPSATSESPTEPLLHPPTPDKFAPADVECAPLKLSLERFQQWMAAAFHAGESAESLIAARTLYSDRLLTRLWSHLGFKERQGMALIAVGGYGRGELHPLSDIDLLILSKDPLN